MDLKLIVKSSVTITEFSTINAARPCNPGKEASILNYKTMAVFD